MFFALSPLFAQQPATPPAAEIRPIPRSTAPQLPPVAELRAMNQEQLETLGDDLRQAKDYLGAIDCYREALRRHASASTYNRIAISELLLHHLDAAAKAARKAVRKDKGMAEAWNNLAVAYYLRHDYQSAIHNYQRAIALTPGSASFHNNLAAALMDSQQTEAAVAEYRKAFALDPDFFARASQNGISAHTSSPRDRARFAFVMARLFAASGDLERALHFLRSALEDGYPAIDDVYRDKEFEAMRQDERFLALMKDRPLAIR